MSLVQSVGAPAIQTIRTALMAGLFLSCLLIAVLSLVALNELDSLREQIEDLVQASDVKTGYLYDMRISARERNLHLIMSLQLEDEFLKDDQWMKFREQGGVFLEAREKYKALNLDEEEIRLLEEQRDISVEAVTWQYRLYDFMQEGDQESAFGAIEKALEFQTRVFEILDRMLDIQKDKNAQMVKAARMSQEAASRTVVMLGIIVIILMILSSAYIIRRISEQALQIESEGKKFKALIEGSMDAVLVIEDGLIVDANDNALKMFSVATFSKLKELGEKYLLRFRVDEVEDNQVTVNVAIDRAEVGRKNRYHWFFNDFNNEEISVDVEITAIDIDGKKLVQMVVRDVTEREIFQNALKEMNENLENKVHERTEELKDLNTKIANIARSAGMAEVASGVLHNVGNVLNSINVSTSVLKEQIKNCKAANIEKIAQLLSENKANICNFIENDERGQYVIPYIEKLSEQIQEERKNQVKELDYLGNNIEHIKTIISMQQSYAGSSGVIETINAGELFDDAIKINRSGLDNNRIDLTVSYAVNPQVTLDKHKVIQVLVNFISNAKYALMNNEVENRKMTVGMCMQEEMLEFYVEDNGIGIDSVDLGRLFEFGFKKREGGHGYGLHHSALMAKELGGEIAASSQGIGQGARFSLKVPLKNS